MPDTPQVRRFNPSTIHKPFGYSHVAEITTGKLIYISGQVAFDVDGNLVGRDDFAQQVRQVFANLAAALESVGADFHHVVKLNYYCVDTIEPAVALAAIRTVRDGFADLATTPPASTFVVIRKLARPEFLIEVEAVAAV
jgi:enamine deaminase RidA (YjgF/YER057c/UK114 family)